jgi:hypothetical protein
MPFAITSFALFQETDGISTALFLLSVAAFIIYYVKFDDKHNHLEYDDHVELTEERREKLLQVVIGQDVET